MQPSQYGPFPYVPLPRRPRLALPDGARVAVWISPNIEFFCLDDVMPGNQNERTDRARATVPDVRNWSVRDYGNRVGIWRLMDVLDRYGIRATAALNSELCHHYPEIIEAAAKRGWEFLGHGITNAMRNDEMEPAQEREMILAALHTIESASGERPVGWLSPGLAENWGTLRHLAEAGVKYVCDWPNDDQPYGMRIGDANLVSLPYSVQANDVAAYFDMKASVPEFEAMLRRQFDVLYHEGAESGRVMSIAVHPYVSGQPHRIGALDAALEYICSHEGVWLATGREIVGHYLESDFARAMQAA